MRNEERYITRPILSLQTMLRSISQTDSRVLPVIPDGQYGSNTFASVRSFQEAYGLPPTGEADLTTWNTVVSVYESIIPSITNPSTTPAWNIGRSVQPGQFNYHLYLVQAMLAALSDFFPDLQKPGVNGTLDSTTQQGLKWLQAASGLQQTGALDTQTWNYLNALYRTTIADGT